MEREFGDEETNHEVRGSGNGEQRSAEQSRSNGGKNEIERARSTGNKSVLSRAHRAKRTDPTATKPRASHIISSHHSASSGKKNDGNREM